MCIRDSYQTVLSITLKYNERTNADVLPYWEETGWSVWWWRCTQTSAGWRWRVLILIGKRLVGLLGGEDVHELVQAGYGVYSPLMGKRLVSLLGGGDVHELVQIGDGVYLF